VIFIKEREKVIKSVIIVDLDFVKKSMLRKEEP